MCVPSVCTIQPGPRGSRGAAGGGERGRVEGGGGESAGSPAGSAPGSVRWEGVAEHLLLTGELPAGEAQMMFVSSSHSSSFYSQGCDLPEQSTVHVVLPPPGSSSSQLERLAQGREEEQDRLTRVDLSSSRLPAISFGLAVTREGHEGGGAQEPQAAAMKGQYQNLVQRS